MSAAPLPSTVIAFDEPPRRHNAAGKLRTVGVEIEFAGLSAEAAARILGEALGGSLIQDDAHAFQLHGSAVGDVAVALDVRTLHPDGPAGGLFDTVQAKVMQWAGTAASYVLPCEIVTEPVPLDRLPEIDRVIAVLREAGAKGTQDGALYAFGLHLNPEAPALDAATLVAILKAFVLLDAWLRRQAAPDLTRSLLGFADPFPGDYGRRLAAADYWPDLATLIDDYLTANPTRNRDCDALPLFLYLDEARVRAKVPGVKIRPRPTFHYRLPDARVSDPGWSIAPDWNRWVAVERLAADLPRLEAIGEAFRGFAGEPKSWAEVVERLAFA